MPIPPSLTRPLANLVKRATSRKAGGYQLFDLTLSRSRLVSPSLASLVFTGEHAQSIHALAADQRIKLFFPLPGQTPAKLPAHDDWHVAFKALPMALRPAMRTYTLRRVNPAASEVEVEFVLHGEHGPASAWATHAQPGDTLQMVAPHAGFDGDPGGYEWNPPAGIRHVLLIGDETALPAIAGILETLAAAPMPPRVEAFIEVPDVHDTRPLVQPGDARVVWLPRAPSGARHGEGMCQAAREAATLPAATGPRPAALGDVDIEKQVLWDRATPTDDGFYAWVAGESAAVMAIRKHWVAERGIDRRSVALMGYWRLGRALE